MEIGPNAASHRSWAFYIILLVIIAAAGIALGLMEAADRPDTASSAASTSSIIMGDLNTRLALADERISSSPATYAQSALENYSDALPDPSAHRRIGILKQVLLGQSGLSDLKRIADADATKGLSDKDKSKSVREAETWAIIYSGKTLTKTDAARYAALIDEMDLGPLKEAAKAEIYAAAGMPDQANALLDGAREQAYLYSIILMVILVAIVVMGLAGLVVLARFLSRSAQEAPPAGIVSEGRVLLYVFVVFLVSSVLFSALAESASQKLGSKGVVSDLIFVLIANAAAFLVGILTLRVQSERFGIDVGDIGLRMHGLLRSVKQGLAGYSAALPLMFVALAVSAGLQETVFRQFQTAEHPIVPMMSGGGIALWLVAALAVVLAPIIEEIFFRGVLYCGLRSRMGMWGAAVFSGLLFASIHPTLPTGFLPIMALGIVLAVLREKTGSLYPCMVSHALNNGIMLAFAAISS